MSLLVIYDNTIRPNEIIQEIIGDKSFGDVVIRRKHLKNYYSESIKSIYGDAELVELDNLYDLETFAQRFSKDNSHESFRILHWFSDFMITDPELAALTLKKIAYIDDSCIMMCDNRRIGIMFHDRDSYAEYLRRSMADRSTKTAADEWQKPGLAVTGVVYIGEIRNFVQCLTGNFDSRYFNSLQGTEYIIRKSSSDKEKIKSEYKYYHLLPEKMQRWFVMPFDYQENASEASYAMERLHMTDLAVKWVHGSVGMGEFQQILDMYFTFFQERNQKDISLEEYRTIRDALYIEKVKKRIDILKKLPDFQKIARILAGNRQFNSIDAIFEWYLKLKAQVEARIDYPCVSVIGHGDPCFSNVMYNYSTSTLKFIDPKGAILEEDLYTNPYYDIAKLSHSVCGNYDFFNNAMFDILIDEKFEYSLSVPFDNTVYKLAFRKKVEENGYDYWTVRLYEASLFLSMLSLHIDYPYKVLGFLLNAVNILKEIEENVS